MTKFTSKYYIVAIILSIFCLHSFALAQEEGLDGDGDGLVSLAEVQAAYPDVTEQDFTQADGDGDGQLNEDELSMAFMLGLLPANY